MPQKAQVSPSFGRSVARILSSLRVNSLSASGAVHTASEFGTKPRVVKMVTSKNTRKKVKETSIKKSTKTAGKMGPKKLEKGKAKKSTIPGVKTKAIKAIAKPSVGSSKSSKSVDLVEKRLLRSNKKRENVNDKPQDPEPQDNKVESEDKKSAIDGNKTKPNLKRKRVTSSKKSTVQQDSVKSVPMPEKGSEKKSEIKDNVVAKKNLKRRRVPVKIAKAEREVAKDLSKDHILQCITAIFHLTEEQLKSKNALFDGESHPVFMQVTCIRVPKTPKRQMRMLLPHSIVAPTDEVALFVCDTQRGRRKDFEPTVERYEDLLKENGVTSINTVIPMNQLKTEYDQFELKKGLVSSYDHFLVDGRIAGHISHLLGSEFYKKRKLPVSIRMQSKDLKHEIEHALKKTSMQLHSHGDTHIVQVGSSFMSKKQIAENILSACESLAANYPGGWSNIRALRIKTPTSIAIPIYITLKNKNAVPVPMVQPRRPKAYRTVEGELSTLNIRAKVLVTPEGDVIIKKKPRRARPPMKQKEMVAKEEVAA